jgi:hypothetical protein
MLRKQPTRTGSLAWAFGGGLAALTVKTERFMKCYKETLIERNSLEQFLQQKMEVRFGNWNGSSPLIEQVQ